MAGFFMPKKSPKEILQQSQEPLLVDFYADWCGHCKKIKPVWDETAEEVNTTEKKMLKVNCGGKSEKEIIDELKSKGKYDEWVKLGSNFGLTSDTLNIETFKIRPYKFYNVYGKIVNVSMIEPNYRSDLDNVAVFEQFVEEDPSHVKQGTYKIVNSNEPLTTTGLATCTGLTMLIGDKKFMTHLDATTPVSSIIDDINKVISEQNVDPNKLEPHIYTGNLETDLTLQKAKDICSVVGIPEKNYIIEQVCMFDIVEAPEKNISKKRPFYYDYKEDQVAKFFKPDKYKNDYNVYNNNYYDQVLDDFDS